MSDGNVLIPLGALRSLKIDLFVILDYIEYMNLKQETLDILKTHNKTPEDIQFVSIGDNWCTFEEFLAVADFEYDEGYGGVEIDDTICLVGHDFWLGQDFWFERNSYDGSEWWEFKKSPVKQGQHIIPNKDNLLLAYAPSRF